jgi:hypothetical protein
VHEAEGGSPAATHSDEIGIEELHAVGGLGSRRPSQLLAEMMELCPDEEEANCFFVFLFPAWLSVQLEADDQADIRQLAARADRLFALPCPAGHRHSESVTAAVMAEDQGGESSVNAIRRDHHHGGGGANRRGGHPGSRLDGAEAEHRTSQGDAAAAAEGICYYHWKFGDEAHSRKGSAARPCNWQGN